MQLDLDSFEYSKPRGVLTFNFYCWIGDTITIHKHGQTWPESVLEALQNAAKEYSWLKVNTIVDDFVQVKSSQPILKVAEAIAAQFEGEGIKVHRIIFSSPDRKHEASTFC